MSFWIDLDDVTDVLLPDGWHKVEEVSFSMDAYEFHWHGQPMHYSKEGGFAFKEKNKIVVGPVSSILAIKKDLSPDDD